MHAAHFNFKLLSTGWFTLQVFLKVCRNDVLIILRIYQCIVVESRFVFVFPFIVIIRRLFSTVLWVMRIVDAATR